MKLRITVPKQVFEYDLTDDVVEEYIAATEDEKLDFFDSWVSDTWPEKIVQVVAS